MSKLKNVWVITDKASAYAELCSGARGVAICVAGSLIFIVVMLVSRLLLLCRFALTSFSKRLFAHIAL